MGGCFVLSMEVSARRKSHGPLPTHSEGSHRKPGLRRHTADCPATLFDRHAALPSASPSTCKTWLRLGATVLGKGLLQDISKHPAKTPLLQA